MRVLMFISLLVSVLFCAEAHSQLIRINAAYTGESPTQLPAFLAKETGIFAKNGLEVQLIRTNSSVAMMSLLAGEMTMLQIAAPTVITSKLRGSDTVFIAGGVVTLDYWLMRSEEHTSELQSRFGISYAVFCLKKK